MAPIEAVAGSLRYFTSIGLLSAINAPPPKQHAAEIERHWGVELEDLFESQQATDMVVLDRTAAPVFRVGPTGYDRGDESYVRAVRACGEAGPDCFALDTVTETWPDPDNVEVSITANGQSVACAPGRKYFDARVIGAVNQTLAEGEVRRFFTDGEAYVALLSPEQHERVVADRSWYMQVPPGPVAPKSKRRWKPFGR